MQCRAYLQCRLFRVLIQQVSNIDPWCFTLGDLVVKFGLGGRKWGGLATIDGANFASDLHAVGDLSNPLLTTL